MFKAREAFATFATSFSIFHFATSFCFTMGATFRSTTDWPQAYNDWYNDDWYQTPTALKAADAQAADLKDLTSQC